MTSEYDRIKLLLDTDIKKAFVPYFYTIRPGATVAAGAITTINLVVGVRDFIWTHLAWTSSVVGLPAAGMDFRVLIRDVSAQTAFSDFRFNMRPVTGNHAEISDNPMTELSWPWRFIRQTTISAEFENIGTLASIPELVLHGFLVEGTK